MLRCKLFYIDTKTKIQSQTIVFLLYQSQFSTYDFQIPDSLGGTTLQFLTFWRLGIWHSKRLLKSYAIPTIIYNLVRDLDPFFPVLEIGDSISLKKLYNPDGNRVTNKENKANYQLKWWWRYWCWDANFLVSIQKQ